MSESSEFRSWDEMIPDALGLIFRNLSLQDVLTLVPGVCKSWRKAVSGPYCWQEINIDEWCQRCEPEKIVRMLQVLIPRSSGCLRKLSVSSLPNDLIFQYVAEHGCSLRTLEMPRSEISDSVVEEVAVKLANITFLDVSYCVGIGARALEALGKNCKYLVKLKRVMHPVEVVDKVCQDDEAHAIACTMPKLKHLEIAYLLLTNVGILEILSACKKLEFLDMRGCWDIKLDQNFLKDKYSGLKVLGPLIVDCYERSYWDYCSDYSYSDSSGYLSWEYMDDGVGDYFSGVSDEDAAWDEEQALESLEVRFYGNGFDDAFAGSDWPASP